MRLEVLNSILSELNGSTTDIVVYGGLSTDGLIIPSMLPGDVIARPATRLGPAFLDIRRAADSIARII